MTLGLLIFCAIVALFAGFLIGNLVKKPSTKVVEKEVPVEKVVEKEVPVEVEKIIEKEVEKIVEVPVEKVVEKIVTEIIEKEIEVPVEVVVEKVVEKIVEVEVPGKKEKLQIADIINGLGDLYEANGDIFEDVAILVGDIEDILAATTPIKDLTEKADCLKTLKALEKRIKAL